MKARNPLPEGTFSVGVGVGLSGACLYGVLIIVNHALGKDLAAPFAAFWPVLFVGGPGFFLPLEQEVGRALAARRARGVGGGPVVARAAIAGGITVTVLVAATLLLGPVITSRLFDGNLLLLACLGTGLVAYYAEHLARGTLSGNGRFRAYGYLLGAEGLLRVAICIVMALAHIKDPGAYALAMVLGSAGAVAVALRGEKDLMMPGPPAPWSELSTALGFLLATSVLSQLLINVGPICVKLLATPAQEAQTTPFLDALIISRVPLFLFQAVQAALLPKLAGLASAGRHAHLRRSLIRLTALVAAFGVVATVGSFLLGPWMVQLMFGAEFANILGHQDLGLLAAASSCFMATIVFTQALIALHGYWRALAGWIAGSVGFVVVTALGDQLFRRVEFGLVGGAVAATVVTALLLLPLISGDDTIDTQEFLEQGTHVVAEP